MGGVKRLTRTLASISGGCGVGALAGERRHGGITLNRAVRPAAAVLCGSGRFDLYFEHPVNEDTVEQWRQ
jgi:hypothetical protein